MENNLFPDFFFLPLCIPDGCVCMCAAAYEFRIMMDGTMKSKEHEAVYTRTLYISIHLLLMQQMQLWGLGTLCWRPNESWVIYHVESHSSSPACMVYTTPSWFLYKCFAFIFCYSFILILKSFFLFIFPVLLGYMSSYFFLIFSHLFAFAFFFLCLLHCSLLSHNTFLNRISCLFLICRQTHLKYCSNMKSIHLAGLPSMLWSNTSFKLTHRIDHLSRSDMTHTSVSLVSLT